jgi:cbb3-type cytochrome oxidase maturation protein
MMAPAPSAGPKSGTMRASASGRGAGGAKGGRSERRSVRGKAKAVGGKELMIACAVLGGLVCAVVFFWVLRSGQKQDAQNVQQRLVETENKNFRLAKEWGEKAWTAGLTFVMGKEETSPDALKAIVQDPPCYNVIYVRNRKDKKGRDDSTQIEYSKDRLVNGDIPSVSRDENGWHMVYAFAENKTIPLVRAQKSVQPAEGDTVNKPGTITVMIRAEEDDHFKRARDAKAPEENKDKGGGK